MEQIKRILLQQGIVTESEELGPPALRITAAVPRAEQAGRLYAVSPQSLEQSLAGFGWRITASRVEDERFILTIEKPRLTP